MAVSDFLDMMPHTVSHEEFSDSRDEYGVPTYGSSVDYRARVTYKNELVRADDGSEIVAKGVVWLNGSPTISTQDQITLPNGTTPPILLAELISDESGSHHTKIYFG